MIKRFVFILFIFGLGMGVGFVTEKSFSKESTAPYAVREKGFTYISPLLRCETPVSNNDSVIRAAQQRVTTYINQSIDDGMAKNISVYFRDPHKGDWFVVNPEVTYSPASLIKVAIAMAYYKISETQPETLTQLVSFSGPNTNDYNVTPKEVVQPGQSYTVENLIERSLIYSDNDAFDILLRRKNDEVFLKVFEDIQVDLSAPLETDEIITVRNYASFFRTLYNSSYLNNQNSEKLLGVMTRAEFRDGLVAGVPDGVTVSHKFGERGSSDSSTKQLHDCGVVYVPDRPYILCVMTRGTSLNTLREVIKTISSMTYKSITTPPKP